MKNKKSKSFLLSLGLLCSALFPTTTVAAEKANRPSLQQLIIDNDTNHYLTAILNDSGCSAQTLPANKGIVSPLSRDIIPGAAFIIACGKDNLSACKAKIFMNNNCQGEPVGEMQYNAWSGEVKIIKDFSTGYKVTTGKSYIRIDPFVQPGRMRVSIN